MKKKHALFALLNLETIFTFCRQVYPNSNLVQELGVSMAQIDMLWELENFDDSEIQDRASKALRMLENSR